MPETVFTFDPGTVGCEFHQSPKETYRPDSMAIQRVFDVPWGQSLDIARKLIGGPFIENVGGNNVMLRNPPHQHPQVPKAYCTGVEITGVGYFAQDPTQAEAANNFQLARIVATYESLPYDVGLYEELTDDPKELGRYVRKTTKGSGEFITSQLGVWVFAGNEQQVADRIGIWQQSSVITYEWFDVLPAGWNYPRALDKCGMTNDAPFGGYSVNTLVLMDVDVQPHRSPFGDRLEKVTFTMYYKPSGVNYHPRPDGTQTLVHASGDDTRHPVQETDFSELFEP